jgi:hypothetical protein
LVLVHDEPSRAAALLLFDRRNDLFDLFLGLEGGSFGKPLNHHGGMGTTEGAALTEVQFPDAEIPKRRIAELEEQLTPIEFRQCNQELDLHAPLVAEDASEELFEADGVGRKEIRRHASTHTTRFRLSWNAPDRARSGTFDTSCAGARTICARRTLSMGGRYALFAAHLRREIEIHEKSCQAQNDKNAYLVRHRE